MANAGGVDRTKWMLLGVGAAALAGAVAVVVTTGGDRGGSAVDRNEEVRADDELRIERDLANVEDEAVSRSAAPTADEVEDATAAAEPAEDEPDTAVTGLFLHPRGFPDARAAKVLAWPVLPDGSGELDSVRVETIDPILGEVDGDRWSFTGLAPGAWSFTGRSESGMRVAYGASSDVVVLEGAEAGPVTVVLTEYVVSGRVTDASGAPVAGLPVRSTWVGTDWRAGADGPVMRLGRGEFDERSNEQLTDEERAERRALAGAVARWQLDTARRSERIVTTDAAGAYRIALEGPGAADVQVPDAGRDLDAGDARWIVQDFEAEVTETSPVATRDVQLVLSASLAGRLRLQTGNAAAEVDVFVQRMDGGATTQTTDTDADGRFLVQDLEPGRHLVWARVEGADGTFESLWGMLALEAGADLEIDERLEPCGVVTGVVVDGNSGAPVPDVEVVAIAEEYGAVQSSARTDALGRFEMTDLFVCEYRLEVNGRDQRVEEHVDLGTRSGPVDVGTIEVD